jgi:prepilin peptidase CpaA
MIPLPPPVLSCAALAAVALLTAAAAVHDVIARTIPNGWCAALAFAGLGMRLIDHTLPVGLCAGAAVFLVSVGCWRAGWLGGGDVKLLGACALAVPPHLVPALVVDTSLAGALLALLYLAARNRLPRPHSPRPASLLARAWRAERWRLSRGGPLPYAVAIAAATIFVLVRGSVS